jgi:hypothetical protein
MEGHADVAQLQSASLPGADALQGRKGNAIPGRGGFPQGRNSFVKASAGSIGLARIPVDSIH